MTLKQLQKEAKKYFTGKIINRENLYEWINYKSYLGLAYNLKLLKEMGDLNLEMALDTSYVYGEGMFIDYLNGMVATYLEDYIHENHKSWNATWDEEDFN